MSKVPARHKLGDYINNIVYIIGSFGILLTVGCTAINILSVWFTGLRHSELDEIALFALVWVVYVGMGLLYSKNQHVSMDFVVNMLPPSGKILSRIINNIIIIIIATITAYFAWKLSIKSFGKLLTITKIPYFYCDIAVFVGYLHLLLLATGDTIKCILTLCPQKGGQEKL